MEDASTASLLLRLAVSMGVVISLMLIAARLLRRTAAATGGRKGRGVKKTPINLEVIQPLTKSAHVAVVRAAGRELVLGVTDHQVTLLHSSIEPRDSALDLEGSVRTTTQSVDLDLEAPSAGTRIVPAVIDDTATPAGSAGPDGALGQSAWTDALELLREKTVRR